MILDIIKKDLRIILRSRASTAAILLGPVIIVLLVGLAFSQSGSLELSVGIVDKDAAPAYAARLEAAFVTYDIADEATCEEHVKKNILNACVVLRDGAAIVLVDPSNFQLAATLQSAIAGELEAQAQTEGLASADEVISSVVKGRYKLQQDVQLLQDARAKAQQLQATLGETTAGTTVDSGSLSDAASIADSLGSANEQLATIAEQTLADYQSYVNANEQDNSTRTSITSTIDQRKVQVNALETATALANDFEAAVDDAREAIEQNSRAQAEAAQRASLARTQAAEINTGLAAATSSIQATTDQLGLIRVSEGDIVSPIAIDILPVTSAKDNFAFVAQFFFALIIMFSSILLASSIVVRERNSRAYFRNVASPAPDYVFASATYLSVLVIILAQTAILYLASMFLSDLNLFSNLPSILLLIVLIASIFTLIGMAVGYILRTQEAAVVGSITVTSVFLLLSPLILPLETMPGLFRFLGNANPFVIGAELLKNAVLFGFTVFELPKTGVLLLYGVVLAILIFLTQRVTKTWVIERKAAATIADFVAELDIPPEKALRLGNRTIKSKDQLLASLRTMSDEEFEEYVSLERNVIADWIADVYKDKKLSQVLRNKNRAGHIHYLEKKH